MNKYDITKILYRTQFIVYSKQAMPPRSGNSIACFMIDCAETGRGYSAAGRV